MTDKATTAKNAKGFEEALLGEKSERQQRNEKIRRQKRRRSRRQRQREVNLKRQHGQKKSLRRPPSAND